MDWRRIMRKEVYICDRCKKVFHSNDPYVLDVPYTLKLEAITVQDQLEWHYCSDCWKVIKYQLTDSESTEEKKIKEENERLKNTVDWWNSIFILAANDAIKQEKEKRDARSASYSYCCCENVDKQTVAPYSSLK